MTRNKIRWQLPFLVLLIVGTVLILRKQAPFQTDQGLVFGTMYKITYQSDENLKNEIEAELEKVNQSLSPFSKESVITHINQNTDLTADSLFTYVFQLAKQISEETHGAFDITVAPLVNAWGFGFKNATQIDSLTIDSIRQFVGIDKVRMENGKVIKDDPRLMLDCSAIAKGFGVDCVARLFDRKGIKNYMIDIGGELVMKGENAQMNTWRIGINKPIDDSLAVNQELQTILEISNAGMATSGNYRNFYYKDGKKYAHTIDPRTGYPVQHNILSSTVVAKDCATADAYATSFMVLGLDSAKAVCNAHPELDAYFIYSKDNGETGVYFTEGMKKYLKY
ncbi:FAD:protein FMN transferase [Phocaeicola faecicola]|jgi:thiamine biosynthesis lipoprotein|uniref:FAD:protein FMN transferase n=1 Tax=Phocaeicola faecicola TaxID=2739389 RepID=UPI0015E669EA|nr:FAD:protein FMN transferase [Phocaeicola faecicola]MCI5743176.1 FAD:protein FMN transferase [Bacteroides sp.]MDD6909185.1 FAD:protein FMN transferase [Bacteroidaceae bacterium]MDY4873159.1 FAD:protein FMN transferase [Phocaeicola faecicola]